jgi:HEPN domain-containing protein
VPKQLRARAVTAAHVRSYAAKAEEYLAAADSELGAGRAIAATSLAVHAAINAADVVTGVRLGKRAAGQDHEDVLSLLGEAGPDGAELAKEFARLLPLKTKTEYEPDEVPKATATKAVERARRCVAVAHRVVRAQAP